MSLKKILNQLISSTNNTSVRKYFFNTSWLFAEKILRILSNLFIGVWVARFLGPQQYGLYSYVIAFTAIFSGIAQLGLGNIVVRELVSKPSDRDNYIGTAFWLKMLGAVIVIIIVSIILPLTIDNSTTKVFIYIIITGLFFQSFEVIEYHFQSKVLAKIISICKIIQLILSSIIKVYLILSEAKLIFFVFVILFDTISLATSYFISYRFEKIQTFYKNFNSSVARKLLKDSWPLILSSIVITVYMRIDQIMIKEILGEYETGVYSVAIKISESFYFIPMLITTSVFPAIINAKNKNEHIYHLRLQRLFDLMVIIALFVAIIITLCANWLIISLFGQEYQEADQILIIHIWASLFVFVGVASEKWFIVENLQLLSFWRGFTGMIVNILLNIILIPSIGLQGAAIATLISQMISTYIFDIFNTKTRKMFLMKTKSFTGLSLIKSD